MMREYSDGWTACDRCEDRIESGDPYLRGAFGYGSLCSDCAFQLGYRVDAEPRNE